jgi:hypothetical protein
VKTGSSPENAEVKKALEKFTTRKAIFAEMTASK